ncbi:MAG: endonuclease MutS2 [Defluviitaleaceae bacterium]|nr:endonuclease MutS2 [Defluviitaleaceae bacterium]
MDKRSLRTLEYDKIINKLVDKAISPAGKAMCEELTPMHNLEGIEQSLLETGQALEFSMKAGHIPLGGIKDIAHSLKRALIGGVLSIEELFNIGEFIYVCKKVINYSKSIERRGADDLQRSLPPHLINEKFEQLALVADLDRNIGRCIQTQTEMADEASAALSAIRRNIKVSNGRINDALNAVIQSTTYRNMLQDAVITMRGGRFCVPIKQEYKASFPGVVHDASGSGATLFMEPMSVVALNNKIKELQAEEKEEIQRILSVLSQEVALDAPILSLNAEVLTYLDFIFAKAALALDMNASQPDFNDHGIINIKKGRHPLLNVEKIVPTDIWLGDDFSALLITGPNTGGKTVALKTLGLFVLMGMSGLFVPAAHGTQLSIFDNVFADIGDEQSIEQSLSTFSAHMTNIVRILGECTYQSLVLFDELGAGTDPTEGAALAISIIRNLLAKGTKAAITTHYAELKLFALSTENVENGAVEFDLATLSPTYRLLIGVPGKSNAFAIASRLGLSQDVITEAKQILSQDDIRFEDIITDLEISRKAVRVEEERAESLRAEAQRLTMDLENQKTRIANNRDKILNDARAEAKILVARAKEEADGIIKEMRKIKQDSGSTRAAEEQRAKLRQKTEELQPQQTATSAPNLKKIHRPLVFGDHVYIVPLKQSATVVSVTNRHAQVVFGSMEMKVKHADLMLEEISVSKKPEKTAPYVSSAIKSSKSLVVSNSISLRGMLVEEALEELDKYLDDAYLANAGNVEIIHGKGTGALREAVGRYLKKHPHVKSYRLGEFGEGDSGITIAELK